jgi:hypothetical protein
MSEHEGRKIVMSYPSQGIILRNCHARTHKVVVFDEQRGKIEGIPSKGRQSPCLQGSLMRYRAEEWHRHYILHDLELLEIPASWVADDIGFLHHILELAQHFVPPLQINKEFFDFFVMIYKTLSYDSKQLLRAKKVFLCKLFVTLGMYPQLESQQDKILFCLISSDPDIMLKDHYPLLDKKMSTWLYDCLQTHVGTTRLKTLDFLVKVDSDETFYSV